MRVYTDTLEKSRIKEIIEKFKSYSIVNVVLEEEENEWLESALATEKQSLDSWLQNCHHY